ncbi:RUN and FYVE domain-containing protein 2 isoform X1 [Ctenocephalides felis]|uniref:RUN and FYVE domain-containing protein 2 isoform X1 n=1 Tax=Ctenocephalides felis TaxID=7515 RepID=UPI000E6E3D3A|nr:RUN and FYVE domain-containing protein 2 isoform X1 [Ctenocephalides felis]
MACVKPVCVYFTSEGVQNQSNDNDSISRSSSFMSIREISWTDLLLSRNSKSHNKHYNKNARDPAAIERSNLVNICKLVVKELLEQSLRYGRMLDSDHLPLQHFLIVLEHVLRHGLKPKKGLLGPKKELWDLLQSVEKYCPESQDITSSVRDLPTVRTHMGRARAWLRLALMQKKMADYLQALVEHRDTALSEYYESHSLMMSDEVIVIMGLLVGLNVIDCNLCVKGEDLDSQQGVIDFSLYLRSSSRSSPEEDINLVSAESTGQMNAVLDQKNYIEELNRHLNATVGNLQAKVESLTTTNALMKEDLSIAKSALLALQTENKMLRSNSEKDAINGTSDTCSTTSKQSNDANELMAEIRKRQEVEKELELQMCLKAETEMAMKLLEKDIHEKQDTIVSLRRQLEDIKLINLEMYKKLQECDSSLKHKTELVTKLEAQNESLNDAIQQLHNKYSTENSSLRTLKESSEELSHKLLNAESKTLKVECDLRIEREWRTCLQAESVADKDKIANLQAQIRDLQELAQKNRQIEQELTLIKEQYKDSQKTLEEIGFQLSVSKLKLSDMQEANLASSNVDTVWTPDKTALECKGCSKEFSITRRKHHCRQCGNIFCHNCSDKVAVLEESGNKPVRVCDTCWDNLQIS